MVKTRFTLIIFNLILLSQACKQNVLTEPAEVNANLISPDTLHWLTGTWKSESSNGVYTENWLKSGDTCLLGESFLIREHDTVFLESIEIRNINDTLCYIPTVIGQNNSLPVKFTLFRLSLDTVVFQNLLHDFPQRITYTLVQPGSIHAWIDGIDNGIARREDFRMVRLK